MRRDEELTIEWLLAFFCSDVDIFLLKDNTQEKDNEKEYYHKEEIRSQLKSSMSKIIDVLKGNNIPTSIPLLTDFKYIMLQEKLNTFNNE